MPTSPAVHYLNGQFSAAAYAESGNDVGVKLNGSAPFTVIAWVKFGGLCADTQILCKEGEFSLTVDGHSVEARLSSFPVVRTGPESTQIKTEEWHHIAVTFDSTNLVIYIDGYLQAQAGVRGTPATNTNNYKIGNNMEGLVNRISVYPWRMDAEAVRKDMFTAVVKADTTAFFDFSVNPPKDRSTHNWPFR